MIRPPPRSTPFPYTTLFRSLLRRVPSRLHHAILLQQPEFDSPRRAKDRPLHYSPVQRRSEEHTSELQSHLNLVCRLLLEKKKHIKYTPNHITTDISHTHSSN